MSKKTKVVEVSCDVCGDTYNPEIACPTKEYSLLGATVDICDSCASDANREKMKDWKDWANYIVDNDFVPNVKTLADEVVSHRPFTMAGAIWLVLWAVDEQLVEVETDHFRDNVEDALPYPLDDEFYEVLEVLK